MRRCFNCGLEINKRNRRHIYVCCQNQNITKDQIRFKQICFESNKKWEKLDFEKLYITDGLSLPDFHTLFGLAYSETQFLIRFFGLKQRSIKESNAAPQRSAKHKSTCQERYGQDNVSQVEEVKAKKRATFFKNYGVDNLWKLPAYYDWLHDHMIAKYGKASLPNRFGNKTKWWEEIDNATRNRIVQSMHDGYREYWKNLSEEEKDKIIQNRCRKMLSSNFCSKQESRVASSLTSLGLGYKHQFWIARRSYDFRLYGFDRNLIIEYNGDFWHANPTIYKSEDLLSYPEGKIRAADIWTRDETKKNLAEKYGYTIVYIWESEIKKLSEESLQKLIVDRLEQVNENQTDTKSSQQFPQV